MFSIIVAKLTAKILHVLGKGATTLPGRVALYLKYNILNSLSKGVKIICVTGTNGKTTTCALIEHALKQQGVSYFINKSGANMITGVATAFVMNSSIFGKCKKNYAILECDENSLPMISRYIDADVVVVTNLFRDQLDRYGEISHTLNKIKEGIENMPQAVLVLNGDCPLTFSLSHHCSNKVLTFGINSGFQDDTVSDNRFCPFCNTELAYHSRVYAQLGNYYCPNCSYQRTKPNFLVTDIIDICEFSSSFVVDGNLLQITLGGVYNIYNFCSAALALRTLGFGDYTPLCSFSGAFGRMERFKNGTQNILLMLVKNPVGFSSCIKYASKIKGEIDIAFALNDNAADGKDVSWIWDSSLADLKVKNAFFYTVGTRSYDMALRLKYDSFSVVKALENEDYKNLIDIIRHSTRDFVVLANYTSMMNMRHLFIENFGGKEFWQ